jgi:hypothetical protein
MLILWFRLGKRFVQKKRLWEGEWASGRTGEPAKWEKKAFLGSPTLPRIRPLAGAFDREN